VINPTCAEAIDETDADIVIVGAGAAGLAAAIFAAQTCSESRIVLLDTARQIGAKILVSGGGRCNVTHKAVTPGDFHGSRRFIARVLDRFDQQETVRWFESMGVMLKQEPTGKLFPVGDHARTVLLALLDRCDQLKIQILTNHRVEDIIRAKVGFHVRHSKGRMITRRVIMATGGRSLPKTGSDGHGWSIAQKLGHSVSETDQALVPLVLTGTFFHNDLSGIAYDVTLTTMVDGKKVDRRSGSLLWTHFGISGPVVLDASRQWINAHRQGCQIVMVLSSLPGETFEQVDQWLSQSAGRDGDKTVATILSSRLPHRVAKALCEQVDRLQSSESAPEGLDTVVGQLGRTTLSQLRREQRRTLTRVLTELALPVERARGWNYAEVTSGGIPLQEVNPHSMASRKVPGLYFIGEMLDCDGRIGGFNFQWAWTTGYIAGCAAAGNE